MTLTIVRQFKKKKIYHKVTEESFEKISNLDKSVNIDKLVFKFKGDEDFSRSDNALELINKARNGEISLNEAKNEQEKLKSSMGEIKKVRKKYLLKESNKARTNIENLYNTRKPAIDFFDEYTSRTSEARCQAKKGGAGLKILTPNQML